MDLPSEIVNHIFVYLRGDDLFTVALVNKHCNDVSMSESLWKIICKPYHFETWEENHIWLLDPNFCYNGGSIRLNPEPPTCTHSFDYEDCEAIRPKKKRKLDLIPFRLRARNYRRFYYQLMPWKCSELRIFDGSIVHKLQILLSALKQCDIDVVKSGTIDEITHFQEDLIEDDVVSVNTNNTSVYTANINASIDQNVNNHRIDEENFDDESIHTNNDSIIKEDSNGAIIITESKPEIAPRLIPGVSETDNVYSESSSSSASENSQARLNSFDYASHEGHSVNDEISAMNEGWEEENSWDESSSGDSLMDAVIPFSKSALKTVPFMGGYFGFTLGRDETHYLTILNGAAGGRTVILELPNKEKILLDTPIVGCRKTALDTFDDEESTRKQFWYTWLHFKQNCYKLYDKVLKGGIFFHKDLTSKMNEEIFNEKFPQHEQHHHEKDLAFKKIPDYLCGIRGTTVLHFVKKKLTGKIWTYSQDEPYIRQAPRDIFGFLLERYNMIKQKVTEYIGDELINFEEEKTFSGNGRDLYHCVKNLIESGCTDEIILDSGFGSPTRKGEFFISKFVNELANDVFALWTLKGGNKFTLKMFCGVKADDFFTSFIILLREVVKVNAKQANIITSSKFFSYFNNANKRKI